MTISLFWVIHINFIHPRKLFCRYTDYTKLGVGDVSVGVYGLGIASPIALFPSSLNFPLYKLTFLLLEETLSMQPCI